jgi:hypothetical protein
LKDSLEALRAHEPCWPAEFDYGSDRLVEYVRNASWPILGAANLAIPRNHPLSSLVKTWISRDMLGVKVRRPTQNRR